MFIDSASGVGFVKDITDWVDEQESKLEKDRKKVEEYKTEIEKHRETAEEVQKEIERVKDVVTGKEPEEKEVAVERTSVTNTSGITPSMLVGGAVAAAVVTYILVRK